MEIIVNRLAKICGAGIKGFGYIFHFFFPNKRFTIPKHSPALIKKETGHKIPKIIWQTNFTNKVTLPVYCNYLFIRLLSPDWEYRYHSTEDRDEFLKEKAPKKVYEAYSKLTNGAAQADLWRIFILDYYGGVYMDIDGHTVWPLSKIIDPEDKEVFLINKKNYFTNYFIASTPNNPILKKNIEIIVDNIRNKRIDKGVYYLTGPKTLNKAIGDLPVKRRLYKYTCIQGSFTNEHFQYIDRPRTKWTYAKNEDLLKD